MMSIAVRYDRVAVALHWITAVLVLIMLCWGFYMSDLPREYEGRHLLFKYHKSLGLSILALVLLRLAWRWTHHLPAWPPSMPNWQIRLAGGMHRMLYALLLLQPLSGYLSASFSGYKTWFWVVPMPHWGWKQPVLNELFSTCHTVFAWSLVICVSIHLAGALAHLYLPDHENALKRMLPFRGGTEDDPRPGSHEATADGG